MKGFYNICLQFYNELAVSYRSICTGMIYSKFVNNQNIIVANIAKTKAIILLSEIATFPFSVVIIVNPIVELVL